MLITSPNQLPEKKDGKIYVFLAGPIQGAPDWQSEVPKKFDDKYVFLSPRREQVPGKEFDYSEQLGWERIGLLISDVILFWIPPEIETIEGRSYAQSTRTEFGEYLAKGKRIIVGAWPGFSGRRYFDAKLGEYKTGSWVHETLEEALDELSLVLSQLEMSGKIWFTSDTHFSSDRALKLSKRPFKDTADMDWEMIKRWNSRVAPGDIVFHLGDFGEPWPLQYLNGNITLLEGNYEKAGYDRAKVESYGVKIIDTPSFQLPEYKYILCHEPTVGKEQKGPDDFVLFGHIHGRQRVKEFGVDVGVDANNFYPMSLDDVEFFRNAIDKGYYDQDVWC